MHLAPAYPREQAAERRWLKSYARCADSGWQMKLRFVELELPESARTSRASSARSLQHSPRQPLLARWRAVVPTALRRCGREILQEIFGGICSCFSRIARGLGCRFHDLLCVATRPTTADPRSTGPRRGSCTSERTHQNCQKPMQKTTSKIRPSTRVTITTEVGGQPSHPMNGFSVAALASFAYTQALQRRQQQ